MLSIIECFLLQKLLALLSLNRSSMMVKFQCKLDERFEV